MKCKGKGTAILSLGSLLSLSIIDILPSGGAILEQAEPAWIDGSQIPSPGKPVAFPLPLPDEKSRAAGTSQPGPLDLAH